MEIIPEISQEKWDEQEKRDKHTRTKRSGVDTTVMRAGIKSLRMGSRLPSGKRPRRGKRAESPCPRRCVPTAWFPLGRREGRSGRCERLRQGLADSQRLCCPFNESNIPSCTHAKDERFTPCTNCIRKVLFRDLRHRRGQEWGGTRQTESFVPTQTWPVVSPSGQEMGEWCWRKNCRSGDPQCGAGLTDTQPYCLVFKPVRNQRTLEETSNSKQKSKAHKKTHHPFRVKKDKVSE